MAVPPFLDRGLPGENATALIKKAVSESLFGLEVIQCARIAWKGLPFERSLKPNASRAGEKMIRDLWDAPRAQKPIAMTVSKDLVDFAVRYTAAWCSQDSARVAGCFSEDGALVVNDDPPAVGREAIARSAQGFMTAFPDLVVEFDRLILEEGELRWYWTMKGTNTGPGGTGHRICISGFEALVMSPNGLIESARGRFDEVEYRRQIECGE